MNNLISTIISATAALVAIIGGFLISRVITLSSERSAIVRRLREIDNELDIKKEMLERIKLILFEDDVDDFIHDFARDILGGKKSIESLLEEFNSRRLTVENIQPYVFTLKEIFKNITTLICDSKDKESLPIDFDDFLKSSVIIIHENKEWYEIVYKMIRQSLTKKSKTSSFPGLHFNHDVINSAATSSLLRLTPSLATRDRIKEENNLTDEVKLLSGFKEEQMNILKDYGKVSGLWGGLAVLIYACIVGIVIPSTLLPYPLKIYDDLATKKLLLGLFFSQLIALFLYLSVSMYKLTNQDYRL